MFRKFARVHGICPEVRYPILDFTALARADWVNHISRALAALGPRLYNPMKCYRAAHVQLPSAPGNVVTLRTAKLRHRDTCCLTAPHTAPWHVWHGPHHPFADNGDPWPAAVRECLSQCAEEHLHYCRLE